MNRLKKRLRALFRRQQLDRDLEEEMRFHLEMKAEATGDPLEARRKFGNVSVLKEACRDMWTFTALETWWRDIRYGLRTLRRDPVFVLVAVLALALGIGANTTVFTVISKALAFDLGVDHVERIVFITRPINRVAQTFSTPSRTSASGKTDMVRTLEFLDGPFASTTFRESLSESCLPGCSFQRTPIFGFPSLQRICSQCGTEMCWSSDV